MWALLLDTSIMPDMTKAVQIDSELVFTAIYKKSKTNKFSLHILKLLENLTYFILFFNISVCPLLLKICGTDKYRFYTQSWGATKYKYFVTVLHYFL